ncbi:TetR/AcrR family transcriptional regulator [Streptomyces sp. NPDC093097]|uniref:TetR/AcrR family transcriptional regulator n=1 Tax=Streptomyces sp. NPDC093097 TaxID=3366027 RepID=UPI003808FFAE
MAEAGAPRRSTRASRAKEKPRDLRAGLALLWGEQDRPTRGPKPSLTPDRIAATAVALAEAEGLEAASMTKVAAELGVSTMALYRYVPDRTSLVELMVEAVLADRPDTTTAGEGWRPQLAEWTRRSWAVYQAHPWLLAATAMRRQVMGPNQLAWLDAALAALEPTGLPAAQRHQVFLLLIGLVRNLTQQRIDHDEDHNREWERLTGELLDRHADRYPALTRAVAQGVFAPTALDPLTFGLDRILDSVQTLIDRTENAPS